MVYPYSLALVGELGDGFVDEADVLGAEVLSDETGCHEERVGGAVAAEADVYHVFLGGRESDYVDDVYPVMISSYLPSS